jgi:hypothetical protein
MYGGGEFLCLCPSFDYVQDVAILDMINELGNEASRNRNQGILSALNRFAVRLVLV